MKVNFKAIEKFVGEVRREPELAIKTKTVAGECDFRQDQPHFSATLEFPLGKTTLVSDQLPFLGGTGSAPDPILYCLYGTAACFAGTMMLIAGERGLAVESMRVTAQNRLNLNRPLGLSKEAPIVEGVWITVEFMGAATEAEMESAVAEAVETCPGAYCITHPIPLTATARKATVGAPAAR